MPAIVVLDLYMPKRNGFDVLAWVRARPGLRRLPIVVLTTVGEGADLDRAYDLGANSCLVKPTSSAGMEEMLGLLAAYWLRLNRPASLLA
jgi:CheY-like chemotaxis protein